MYAMSLGSMCNANFAAIWFAIIVKTSGSGNEIAAGFGALHTIHYSHLQDERMTFHGLPVTIHIIRMVVAPNVESWHAIERMEAR